jgi:hypothetical protein
MITAYTHPVGRAGHRLYRGDRVRVVPIAQDGEIKDTDAVRQRVVVKILDGESYTSTAARYCRKK